MGGWVSGTCLLQSKQRLHQELASKKLQPGSESLGILYERRGAGGGGSQRLPGLGNNSQTHASAKEGSLGPYQLLLGHTVLTESATFPSFKC